MMRPIRVVIRTSRTDSIPYAGSAVIAHFRTVVAGHGANVSVKTPKSRRMLTAHSSATVSAFMIVTVRIVCGMRTSHSLFPCADIFPVGTVSAMRTASRRDGVVACHPSAPVTGSAQGARHPSRDSSKVPSNPVSADAREGGTLERSRIVTHCERERERERISRLRV